MTATGLPRVIGTPGGTLVDRGGKAASWAANDGAARYGQVGERRTAEVVDKLAASASGPTVLHDLVLPKAGIRANIDHIVVSGNRVLILDSKSWRPGFFWTFGGRTRRGLTVFPSADKSTLVLAAEAVARFLRVRGVERFDVVRPIVVVWPSSTKGATTLWAMRFPGAAVMSGAVFERKAASVCKGKPADPGIVSALASLVHGSGVKPSRPAAPTPAPAAAASGLRGGREPLDLDNDPFGAPATTRLIAPLGDDPFADPYDTGRGA